VQSVALRLLAVTYDAHDPARLAHFWAGVLDRDEVDEGVDDGGGVLVPGTDIQLGLRSAPRRNTRSRSQMTREIRTTREVLFFHVG
jgi:hypothetical protein